jgi:hypothetical protein
MQTGGKNYDPANEVLPYQYEPELNYENANSSDENSSDSSDTSDGEGLDKVFKEKKCGVLSRCGVLKIDVCRYLEENWPVGDEDLERTHKLYCLVAYQRCSRWIFRILDKNVRRPFPSCIYAKICDRFASPNGLYTYFKYAKPKKDVGKKM